MHKIYFACSIRGGREDATFYGELVDHLKTRCVLLTEIFADQKLTHQGMNKPSSDIWRIDTDWIREADAVIAEVTNPSLGVGYEIAKAEEWGKPVLALFRTDGDRKLSAMIEGSPTVKIIYYTDIAAVKGDIDYFLSSL